MNFREGIIKPEELPLEEKVYLKKSFFGWGVVHPIQNEDGSMNWFNFFTGGNIWNVVAVAIVVLLFLGFLNEYASTISYFTDCFETLSNLEVCKGEMGLNNLEVSLEDSFGNIFKLDKVVIKN